MGILSFIKSTFNQNEDDALYDKVLQAAYTELNANGERYWWSLKANECKAFTNVLMPLSDKKKVAFIAKATYKIHRFYKDNNSYSSDNKEYKLNTIADTFMRHLLKTKLVLDDDDIQLLVTNFYNYRKHEFNQALLYWPVNVLVNQIEKQVKERGLSEELKEIVKALREKINEITDLQHEKEKSKILEKTDSILFNNSEESDRVKPTFFPGKDEFGNYANATIKALSDSDQQNWFKLMMHAQKASGSKPSKRYLDESKVLFKTFGAEKFKQIINEWFLFLVAMKEKTQQHEQVYNNRTYTFTTTDFLTVQNVDFIKGFVWSCVHFHDKTTLFNLAKLAERTYRKIPGKGPAAAAIGNACLFVLANTKGLDGVGHLSRLKLRIKQSSTQNQIEKYLHEAATEQGVSVHEIEDMAVDDYGLQEAKKEFDFDGYKAVLEITAVGKTTLNWFKPDGSPQKAVPSLVKEKYNNKLKKIKETAKQVELTVSAQRDRLDRMFKLNRSISGTKFNEYYFSHGLMCFLTKKIIWNIERDGKKEAVLFLHNEWQNNKGDIIDLLPDEQTTVSLWHPVFASVEEIKTWREFMIRHQVVQPLKQAFREVYLLTDAEINTVSYSNRMAAHLLKQHQFNSLAKTRGWKYSLMGAYDDGIYNQFASIDLKEYGLRAQFWVNEVNADDAFNDTGIWLYISTDQVRFTDTTNDTVKDLLDVPALVLSEVMRDVDLFVGVASVGNDPNWRDSGGLPAYADYWQSYSFGDLTEVAKTRKNILEGLLPRLKIGKVSTIKDKFLVVQGKLRTYKIHIGSTNILMEPNDQYLCIVPDRSKKEISTNIFLPFEGDSGLSVILSKAMLLAEDDLITDTTITSQINRR